MNDDALIKKLLEKLQQTLGDDLIGVLVGGSRVRDEHGANSDFDVVVVVGRPERKRWNFVIDGVEIETLINPLAQMKRYFADERDDGRGLMPHLCATGSIIFDPRGVVASLQSEARTIWQSGPPPLSQRERWQFRYHVAVALRDLDDVVEARDESSATLLIGILRPKLIDMHYRIAGRWLQKPKRIIRELESWDPRMAALMIESLATQDMGSSTKTVRKLAFHVLSPIGGPMPLEWEIEWGPAQEP